MQRLEVSGAVRPIYESLGVKRLILSPSVVAVRAIGMVMDFKKWRQNFSLSTVVLLPIAIA